MTNTNRRVEREHKQFDDNHNGVFFLRTSFLAANDVDVQLLTARFQETATEFGMYFQFSTNDPARVI